MRALVTGASSGIGAAMCNTLVDSDFEVHGIARTKPHPPGLNDKVTYSCLDISDSSKLDLYLDELIYDGKLNALILNAGVTGTYEHFKETSLTEIKYLFDINFFSNIQILKRLETLLERKASVVVISSNTLKFRGSSHNLPYAASKAALESAALSASKIYANPPYQFRINIIRPGLIDSGLNKKLLGYSASAFEKRSKLIPIGRVGQTADIVNIIEFLISPRSDFIMGQIFSVAGGE